VIIDIAGGIAGIIFYGTYYFVYRKGYKRGLSEVDKGDLWVNQKQKIAKKK